MPGLKGWKELGKHISMLSSSTPQAVIVDIDGCLADSGELGLECKGDWDLFHSRVGELALADTPALPIVRMAAASHIVVVLLSSRPETCEEQTISWLEEHHIPFDHLLMRPRFVPKDPFKRLAALRLLSYYQVVLAVEDCPREVEMYRSLNIPVLEVHSGCWDEDYQRRLSNGL